MDGWMDGWQTESEWMEMDVRRYIGRCQETLAWMKTDKRR